MQYRATVTFDCADLGRRVTVRYRLPDGMAADVVGILEHCDESSFGIRNKRSELVRIVRADVVAGKVIPSPSWNQQDEEWEAQGRPPKPAPG